MEKSFPKTALIGAGGFLGRKLFERYRTAYPDCVGTYHSSGAPVVDLANPDIRAFRLKETGHKNVVIAAFVVDVRRCEKDWEYTYNRNVRGVLKIAEQAIAEDLKPIFLSTDWVFSGEEGNYSDSAKPNPVCAYGAQKAEVEKLFPQVCDNHPYLIIRLSRMFSLRKGDRSTPDLIADQLTKGQKVKAAQDQVFGPLLTDDAVEAICRLQSQNATGIVNVNSPEIYSRLEMAYEVADALNIDRSNIEPVSILDIDEIRRPKRTNMICERLQELTSMKFTPTNECIRKIAANYRSALGS